MRYAVCGMRGALRMFTKSCDVTQLELGRANQTGSLKSQDKFNLIHGGKAFTACARLCACLNNFNKFALAFCSGLHFEEMTPKN